MFRSFLVLVWDFENVWIQYELWQSLFVSATNRWMHFAVAKSREASPKPLTVVVVEYSSRLGETFVLSIKRLFIGEIFSLSSTKNGFKLFRSADFTFLRCLPRLISHVQGIEAHGLFSFCKPKSAFFGNQAARFSRRRCTLARRSSFEIRTLFSFLFELFFFFALFRFIYRSFRANVCSHFPTAPTASHRLGLCLPSRFRSRFISQLACLTFAKSALYLPALFALFIFISPFQAWLRSTAVAAVFR